MASFSTLLPVDSVNTQLVQLLIASLYLVPALQIKSMFLLGLMTYILYWHTLMP